MSSRTAAQAKSTATLSGRLREPPAKRISEGIAAAMGKAQVSDPVVFGVDFIATCELPGELGEQGRYRLRACRAWRDILQCNCHWELDLIRPSVALALGVTPFKALLPAAEKNRASTAMRLEPAPTAGALPMTGGMRLLVRHRFIAALSPESVASPVGCGTSCTDCALWGRNRPETTKPVQDSPGGCWVPHVHRGDLRTRET